MFKTWLDLSSPVVMYSHHIDYTLQPCGLSDPSPKLTLHRSSGFGPWVGCVVHEFSYVYVFFFWEVRSAKWLTAILNQIYFWTLVSLS